MQLEFPPTPRVVSLSMLCLGLLFPAGSAQAAFYDVTETSDDFVVNGNCTLREALTAAGTDLAVDACPAGSTNFTDFVSLSPGVYSVDLSAAGSDLEIGGSIEIRGAGPGYTIIEDSGAGAVDRLIDLQAGAEVILEQVTLRGGNNAGSGGVVYIDALAVAEFRDVEILDGTAAKGGGLYSEGGITLIRSRVAGNRTLPGSAGPGGGIASEDGTLTLRDVEVSGNQADGDGGGVHVAGATTTFLSHVRARDNIAGGHGGGLHQTAPNFFVEWSEFARNQATIGGGLRATAAGELTQSAFFDNVATVRGGAIADEGDGIYRFSTITRNVAPTGAGVHADSPMMTLLDSNTIARNVGEGVHNVSGAFFENGLVAENSGGNCAGNAPMVGAFNLEDTDTCGFVSAVDMPNFPNTNPLLGPLQDNGGPTPSIGLLPGSPAIDAVSSEIRMNCEQMRDQRGYSRGRPRTQNAADEDVFWCDIGAVEATPAFVVDTLLDGVDADPDDDLCLTAGGDCSLRAAIQQVNGFPGRWDVELGAGTHLLSIGGAGEDNAATGDLDVKRAITLRGMGSGSTVIDGGGLDRVFHLGLGMVCPPLGPDPVLLQDLTIRGGDAGADNGGGFFAVHDVRLERVTLTQNQAPRGSAASGALTASGARLEMIESTVSDNDGGMALYFSAAEIEHSSVVDNTSTGLNGGGGEFIDLVFRNSTMSGNTADATGAFFANRAVLDSSAIYDNSAGSSPGGYFILTRSVVRNSIVANNRVGGVADNCSNQAGKVSLGFNITDTVLSDCGLDDPSDQSLTDPLLGALANNGGPTPTHEPLAGSPAIDAGDPSSCPERDQRGLPRPYDGDDDGSAVCDIGPVELPEPGAALGLAAGAALLSGLARRRAAR